MPVTVIVLPTAADNGDRLVMVGAGARLNWIAIALVSPIRPGLPGSGAISAWIVSGMLSP